MKPVTRIAIVGVGQVGGAAAYALVLDSVASELLLVDINVELRDGQIRDLSDVAFINDSDACTRVRAASYHDASQCDIVVITVGSKCTIGQTALDYTYQNISKVRNVVDAMKPFRSDAIVFVVSNPVDLLTSLVQEISGLPKSQVFGSGTFLDSMRLRGLVADRAAVSVNSMDIYALGVQGEPQVVAWSTAKMGGIPIEKVLSPNTLNRAEIENECKHRSQSIIRAKGSTPFGIGSVVSSICSSILLDKRDVRPVSHFQQEFGCSFSLPAVVGRSGIVSTFNAPFESGEEENIAQSAKALKKRIDRMHQDLAMQMEG